MSRNPRDLHRLPSWPERRPLASVELQLSFEKKNSFDCSRRKPTTIKRQERQLSNQRQQVVKMAVNYVLHEGAVGYSLYEVVRQADIIGIDLIEHRESINDLSKFTKLIKLVSFTPWP
jgi:hypothetical protein